jgi:DNA processing protein
MSGIAVGIARTDDAHMPGARAKRSTSKYLPPPRPEIAMLSEAVAGTGRLESSSQLNFLPGGKERGDIRLYYAGDLSLLRRPCVSIVGTRDVSSSGIAATEWVTRALVKAGIVIVSGLAYGVDAVAHKTAIATGGKTIAVIGTPLDKASPSENARLQEEIYREHLLISQFPSGANTFPANFPVRNRLMAALSDATVVIEAKDKSGTLHQAAECTRLGRPLFIAKPLAESPDIAWPKDFLKYDTCFTLERVSQIIDKVLKSSQ